MLVSLLVAMDEDGAIGIENRLPWRLPADLKRFKSLTWGHHLIMGRKTYESIGRPLPGRTMLVLSRNPAYLAGARPETVFLAPTLEAALRFAQARGDAEVFVIGGRAIFAAALPVADRLYLTRVHARVKADVFFPPLNLADWQVVSSEFYPADDRNPFPTTFMLLQRV